MTSIFDRWTDLDPALALHRIETAHGSAIFDRDSYTDSQRALHQIETALDVELDDVYGLLDPSSIEGEIDAALDGGGSTPDWVPANAKIYIDLVNDRAWTEADGEVAIDTLLGADANTENGWGPTGYNGETHTASGLVYNNLPPAIIGSARTMILSGSTSRFQFAQPTDVSSIDVAILAADGNDAIDISLNPQGSHAVDISSYGGPLSNTIPSICNAGVGAVNVVAFTSVGTRLEVACNGSNPTTDTLDASDRPAGNPLTAIVVDASTLEALQSITIYDALPSTAGLSALSETGVTNTAPTAITWEWGPQWPDGAATVSGSAEVVLAITAITDAEGNPATYTISEVDQVGGFPVVYFHATQKSWLIANSEAFATITPGDYSFTIRATDTGGLYVEQQFTITVTA